MKRALPFLLLCTLFATSATARPQDEQAGEHRFVLTGVGAFAVFADMTSLERDGDGLKMRAFQVPETGYYIGDEPYWGDWSWWRFDCAAHTVDRLDIAAVRAGGAEDPAMPDPAPAYEAVGRGAAAEAELLAAACDPASVNDHSLDTLEEAVWSARVVMAIPTPPRPLTHPLPPPPAASRPHP